MVNAPNGINARANRFWKAILRDYELRSDEMERLEVVCREMTIIDELEAVVQREGYMAIGSAGQRVVHPAVAEMRQHRTLLLSALKSLGIDDAGGGETDGEVSAKNRAAAQSRWSKEYGAAS